MQTLWLVVLVYFTCIDNGMVNGIYITTMLPLPRDLKLLLDSMYDDGYAAEYLIKYDPSKDVNSQTDFLLGWDGQNRNSPNEYSGAIIDPDRDGVRNIPPWMNFTKAVFVPNEIEYKIRTRHKFHPHSGRIGGTLQKQVAQYNDDEVELSLATYENQDSKLSSNSSKIKSNTHETLPIPEYEGRSTSTPIFKFQQSLNKKYILPPTTKKLISPKNKTSQVNIPKVNNPKSYIISPSSDSYQTHVLPQPENIIASPSSLPTSGFSWVELLKKTFKYKKRDNETDSKKNDSEKSLDSLHLKLINMRDLEDQNPKSLEEKKYLSSLKGKKPEDVKQTKRLKQLRPTIIRSKIMRPGHKATYIQHFGPFNF